MREADLALSRRTFLRRALVGSAIASASLVVGDEVFEFLERLGPRRLLVPGIGAPAPTAADVFGVSPFAASDWDALLKEAYERVQPDLLAAITPLRSALVALPSRSLYRGSTLYPVRT